MTYLDRKEKKLQAKAEPVNFIVQVRRSPGLAAAFARALGCWNGPLALACGIFSSVISALGLPRGSISVSLK